MTAKTRVYLLFLIDLAIIWFSIVTSYMFRFSKGIPDEYTLQMLVFGLIATVTFGGSLIYFGLYRRLWQYASIDEIISVFKAIVVGAVLSFVAAFIILPERVPSALRCARWKRSCSWWEESASAGECSAMIVLTPRIQRLIP